MRFEIRIQIIPSDAFVLDEKRYFDSHDVLDAPAAFGPLIEKEISETIRSLKQRAKDAYVAARTDYDQRTRATPPEGE